jgi:3',5'-cyclic AMP phosphodiesterase CpdA
LNWLFDEILDEVRQLDPDFAILTGDMIWGDVQSPQTDSAAVVAEWEELDRALRILEAPLYRVPGNHDIAGLVTRDIYHDRYGRLPQVADIGRVRLLLLSSAWIPDDDDTRKRVAIRGQQLDSLQVAFLREALADTTAYDHAFVAMHHLLWWEDDEAPWWREVHPILVAGGVRAVFTGDYGPAKFSHTRRDGIDYYQSSVSPDPTIDILRAHEWNRVLAQQFDNFLHVTVADSEVHVEVETLGEVSSSHFSPEHWRAVYGGIRRPQQQEPGGRDVLRALLEHPRGRLAAIGGLALALAGGALLGVIVGRRFRGREG